MTHHGEREARREVERYEASLALKPAPVQLALGLEMTDAEAAFAGEGRLAQASEALRRLLAARYPERLEGPESKAGQRWTLKDEFERLRPAETWFDREARQDLGLEGYPEDFETPAPPEDFVRNYRKLLNDLTDIADLRARVREPGCGSWSMGSKKKARGNGQETRGGRQEGREITAIEPLMWYSAVMRRMFAVAALLGVAAFPSLLGAQMRGGHAFGAVPGPIGRGVSRGLAPSHPAAPAPSGIRTGGPAHTGPVSTGIWGNGFGRTGPYGGWHNGGWHNGGWQSFRNPSSYFNPYYNSLYNPYYYPYYPAAFLGPFSYVGFPSDYQSDQSSEPAEAAPGYAPGPGSDQALAEQVGALTNEVEHLRAEQASGGYEAPRAAAPAPAPADEKPVRTVFAYRDGRQLEAQNYAVVGQTLWVFEDDRTRKIALADLDLKATKKLNDERGVDFTVPTPH